MKKLLLFLFFTSILLAKDINVGDLIKLKITGVKEEQIINSFNSPDFKIEELKENKDQKGEFIISLRVFKVGENIINLGDKKLILNVKSTLTPEDKNIYPHLSDNSDTILYKQSFPILFISGVITSIISFIHIIKNIKFKKRERYISSEEEFLNTVNNLQDNNWDFQLSMAIRKYIDKKYNLHFVSGNYILIDKITSEDVDFLYELDNFKFSSNSEDNKEYFIKKVLEIFEKLKEDNGNV